MLFPRNQGISLGYPKEVDHKELKKEVLGFSKFCRKSDLGLMKMKKILNGETNFCSVSASSEVSVANIDLNCLFGFVGHDYTSG